jgi:hypothetical protein
MVEQKTNYIANTPPGEEYIVGSVFRVTNIDPVVMLRVLNRQKKRKWNVMV